MNERGFKIDERELEKKFAEWQTKFEIPYDCEFQVKTLIKLQMEYDSIAPSDNNTMTRKTLLDMITKAWGYVRLTPKKQEIHKAIIYDNEIPNFIDFIKNLKTYKGDGKSHDAWENGYHIYFYEGSENCDGIIHIDRPNTCIDSNGLTINGGQIKVDTNGK